MSACHLPDPVRRTFGREMVKHWCKQEATEAKASRNREWGHCLGPRKRGDPTFPFQGPSQGGFQNHGLEDPHVYVGFWAPVAALGFDTDLGE